MALSNQQIETFICGFRQQIQALTAGQTAQNAAFTELQAMVAALPTTQATTGSGSSGAVDSITKQFKQAITFLSTVLIKGVLTLTNALAITSGGTGATNAGGARTNLGAAKSGINADITSLTNLTTPLPVNEGGTNSTTAAGARASLSVAALPQTIAGSNFTSPNVNTVCGGSQTVVVTGSSFIAPIGGGACSGTFSFTINGSNFTIIFAGAPCSGTQGLV